MLDKNKKSKLRKLLATISPDDKGYILAENLEEEIKELTEKIENTKDFTQSIEVLKAGLIKLNDNILAKIDTLPNKESLEEVKKKYIDHIQELEGKISGILRVVEIQNNETKSHFEKLNSVAEEMFTDLEEKFDKKILKLKGDVVNVSRGGGNMNRRIKVNGVNILDKYTDMNFLGTITSSVNTTTKEVDVTFEGGGTPGGSDTQVQYNNAGAFGGMQYSIVDDGGHLMTLPALSLDGKTATGDSAYLRLLHDVIGSVSLPPAGYSKIIGTDRGIALATATNFFAEFSTQGMSDDRRYIFPDSNGTLALTSDLTGFITSVSGTANRITSSGGTTPVIDIAATYVGQASITTLGTITTGVWNGTDIAFANIAQGSALSVLGVAGNATADLAPIVAASDFQVFRRSGTSVGFGSIDLSNAGAVGSSVLGYANGGTGNTTFTAGSVIFARGAQLSEDNGSFFFDNTNNILYVGTNTGGAATDSIYTRIDATSQTGWTLSNQATGSGASVGIIFDGSQANNAFIRLNGPSTVSVGSANAFVMNSNSTGDLALGSNGTTRIKIISSGLMRFGSNSTPTAYIHIDAGATTLAPLRFTSGTLTTGGNILAGNMEFLTDKYYGTITTGTARKEFTLNDGPLGTNGRLIYTTTNGRVTDASAPIYSAPTLILVPSATSGASLNMSSGTAPTSPAEGDIWSDSTQKAMIMFSNGIKQSASTCLFTQTADKTVTNTVAETSIIGTGIGGGLTLPTNFFVAGKVIRLRIGGVYTTPALATPSLIVKVKYGATTIATVTTTALLSGATDLYFDGEVLITCRTTGASGTVMVHGDIEYATGVAGTIAVDALNNGGATTTINTTTSNLIDVTVQWDTATATRSVKSIATTAEVLN